MRFPLSIIVWVVALASGASGQFISRDYYPLWGEAYENYGSIGIRMRCSRSWEQEDPGLGTPLQSMALRWSWSVDSTISSAIT